MEMSFCGSAVSLPDASLPHCTPRTRPELGGPAPLVFAEALLGRARKSVIDLLCIDCTR